MELYVAVNSAQVRCPWDGCGKMFVNKVGMERHVAKQHNWPQKSTPNLYNDHIIRYHSGRWPSPCLYPNFQAERDFKTQKQMRYHLERAHGVFSPVQQVPYMPPRPAIKKWVKQKCFVGLRGLYLHVVHAENLILSRVRAKSIHQRLFGKQASRVLRPSISTEQRLWVRPLATVREKFSLQAPEWPFFTTTPHSTIIIPANNSTQTSYRRLSAHI